MFCNNCGKEVSDNLTFCPECGNQLSSSAITNNSSQQQNSKKNKNLWEYFVGIFKNLYEFMITGRSRRAEFWGYHLFYLIICFVAGLIEGLLFDGEVIFSDYVITILAIPTYQLLFKRMHDVGKPAGYAFIPVYNFILCLKDSEPGTNKYGPNPKA